MIKTQNKINLQLFADGDTDTDKSADIFEWEDPYTKETLRLPAKVKVGEKEIDMRITMGHMNGSIRKLVKSEESRKSEGKLKELQDLIASKELTQSELHAKIQEYEDSKLTIEEQFKKSSQREIEKYDKLAKTAQAESAQNFNLFQETKIDNDIYAAFGGFSLSNIEDTKLLIRQKGQAKVVKEADGRYKTVLSFIVDGEQKELSPKEAVDFYLSDPANSHHLKNNLKAGGGSTNGGKTTADGKTAYTRASLQNEATRKEYTEKMMKGEAVAIVG